MGGEASNLRQFPEESVAEPSGFMTDLPQSAYLSLSIKRAISAAQQRSHRYVTLEHLLLALLDDPSALEILEGVRADIPTIRRSIGEVVSRNLATLYTPGEFDLHASYKVERVLQTASDDADRLGCDEVDAAFVIAALSRETENPAGDLLKRNGVAYASAVTWLYGNRGSSPASRASRPRAPAPPPEPRPQPSAAPAPEPQRPQPQAAPEPEPVAEAPSEPEPAVLDEEMLAEAAAMPDEEDLYEPEAEEAAEPPAPASEPEEAAPAAVEQEPTPPAPPAEPRPAPAPAYQAQPNPQPRPPEAERQPAAYAEPRPRQAPQPAPASQPAPAARPPARTAPEPDHSGRSDVQTPVTAPRRPDPKVPPPSRLDEMRLRRGGGNAGGKSRAPLPAPVPDYASQDKPQAKKRARARNGQAPAQLPAPQRSTSTAVAERPKGRSRRASWPQTLMGRLVETIPRRMRSAVTERVEVRISREDTEKLTRGMEGRSEPVRHDIRLTQTMSVALRAPDGGFTIEPLSPETQWIFDRPDTNEVYGRWRWSVTPHEPGQRRLQLIIAARSIGQNGHVGDTALPDQVITVRVRTNYLRTMGSGLKWIAAMMVGGVLTELALFGIRFFGQ